MEEDLSILKLGLNCTLKNTVYLKLMIFLTHFGSNVIFATMTIETYKESRAWKLVENLQPS